jgi:hypothetical protein
MTFSSNTATCCGFVFSTKLSFFRHVSTHFTNLTASNLLFRCPLNKCGLSGYKTLAKYRTHCTRQHQDLSELLNQGVVGSAPSVSAVPGVNGSTAELLHRCNNFDMCTLTSSSASKTEATYPTMGSEEGVQSETTPLQRATAMMIELRKKVPSVSSHELRDISVGIFDLVQKHCKIPKTSDTEAVRQYFSSL